MSYVGSMIIEMKDLKSRLKKGQRLLGLDLGSKTIGIALSDIQCSIASPMETLRRTKFTKDAERLLQIIKEQNVGGIILGLPINMDGTEGPRCQSTRQFAANMMKKTDIPFVLWDERLSTMAVTRTLLEADASRKRRRELVDKMAAAFILQGALDNLAQL
ncbi:Holliday junction resolvase RuvX [Luteithermobacter gelatinilyticus]|uniref:Holliday junction resolvase RuvX n=1 Tax=Luteithermobacter gelatinilyticus TaxID=2582913 RepID=UPI00143DCDF0|nr:Holliday junction resolvase RuvX [Luteithermobacter gelatinilyticus]